LTHSNEVNFNATFSADGLKQKFSDMIDSDKLLTEAQKIELRKSALEGIDRINTTWKTNFEGDPIYQQLGIQSAYEAYDKAFTTTELKDLIAFYSSPLGMKTVTFLGSVRTDIEKSFLEKARPKLESVVTPLVDAETDALAKKIKEAEKSGK
ncbi:MAG: DUF2059 domain-containing protein, partial [Pyrinomonadaceae bacterium]